MKGRRLRFACISLSIALLACRSRGEGSGGEARATARLDGTKPTEGAVPPPEHLVARAWIRSPDGAWARMQHGAAGMLSLLPSTTGELVCAVAGIDAALAPLVDGRGVSYAIVGENPGGDGGFAGLSWVLALPLTDDPRASGVLLAGASPESLRKVGGMRILARSPARAERAPAVGIAPGWLLVGGNEDDVARLGPYAYRSMPGEASPPSEASLVVVAPGAALAGLLSSRWAEARSWLLERDREERDRHGGRSPDHGDPVAILDAVDPVVASRIAFVSGAAQARIELDSGDDDIHAELRVTPGRDAVEDPRAAGLLEAMHPGDASPLLAAPADAFVALLVRDDTRVRAEDERWLAATLSRAVTPRLPPEAEGALGAALERWGRGRGDWMTAGIATGPRRGVWLRTPDQTRASGAVRGLVELSGRPAFRELLSGALDLGPAVIGPAEVPGAEAATLASFPPGHGAAQGRRPPPGLAWAVRDGDVLAGAGPNPLRFLAALASTRARLGDDPRAARALAALADSSTFALLAQPMRLDPTHDGRAGSRDDSPVVLAWGKKQGDLWARVELADALVTEIVRLREVLF